jgi:AAA ATPase domain
MITPALLPASLIGRRAELQQISQILQADQDLLLAGVPGIGRRTLILAAAQQCGVRVVEIDCLRATDYQRWLQLLAEGLLDAFAAPTEQALIQRWSLDQPLTWQTTANGRPSLVWHLSPGQEWQLFQTLLALPQILAEALDSRVVLVFHNFPHLRSWDRGAKWENYLRQEVQAQSRVSYAFIATAAERMAEHRDLQVVSLLPLPDADLRQWLWATMAIAGFKFEPDSAAVDLFLRYVQGHLGDAIALARRVVGDRLTEREGEKIAATAGAEQREDRGEKEPVRGLTADSMSPHPNLVIQSHHIHRSALALVEDLALTFESLILLLPHSQVRVLESLALDPTDSPHARDYIRKHQLSRGGGLQGALASLEQKGLVYGAEYGYRIALPLLAFWLKHRLG